MWLRNRVLLWSLVQVLTSKEKKKILVKVYVVHVHVVSQSHKKCATTIVLLKIRHLQLLDILYRMMENT